MLGHPRSGPEQAAINDALALLAGLFAGAGHVPLAPPHLYLADTLLDLYGEDLRARAFLFPDQGRGNELCLRPDFTVPVALAHGAGGWQRQAAYAYQGPVFRNQAPGLGRPVEYLQAGIERFGDPDPATADAQVFALLHRGLAALGIGRPVATIGDLSIPFAVLDALDMPEARRAALKRHFWRPGRFHDLVERASQPVVASETRATLLALDDTTLEARIAEAGEDVGLRSPSDVIARMRRLAAEAAEPRIAPAEAALIDAILAVREPAVAALARLRAISDGIGPALDRFEARLDALDAQGIDPAGLTFDAGFGRNLEYYDGFVFEMRAPGGGDHPPLTGGGRYDTMTAELGAPAPIPAVGGIIRPEAVLAVRP